MGKLPLSIAKKLVSLSEGESLPKSSFNKEWLKLLEQEEVVKLIRQGRTRSRVVIRSTETLDTFLQNRFQIADLVVYIEAIQSEGLSGHEAQQVAGDTKLRTSRTFKGFLVHSALPIETELHGESYIVAPAEGSFNFIYDFERFRVPPDVTIVGIENPENFRRVKTHAHLFPKQSLFVSRYPYSADLRVWLKSIPNPYVHFGDIDLAGIAIFENEFKALLGERARFFIPPDIERVLSERGSRTLYNNQYKKYLGLHSEDEAVQGLIRLIHRAKKGLEQEVFIGV